MILYICQWQPYSATSVTAVFYARIPLSPSPQSLCCRIKTWLYQPKFIEPGAKINRQYYLEVMLMQELLPMVGGAL